MCINKNLCMSTYDHMFSSLFLSNCEQVSDGPQSVVRSLTPERDRLMNPKTKQKQTHTIKYPAFSW